MGNIKANTYQVFVDEIGIRSPLRGNVVILRSKEFFVVDDDDKVMWRFTKVQKKYMEKLVKKYGLLKATLDVSEDEVRIIIPPGDELYFDRWGGVRCSLTESTKTKRFW